MLKGTTSSLRSADKEPWGGRKRKGTVLEKERLGGGGGNGVKVHTKENLCNVPPKCGKMYKSLASITGSPKSFLFLKRSMRK